MSENDIILDETLATGEEELSAEAKVALYPSFSTFKAVVEEILYREDFEFIIVDLVDDILIAEQNSLTQEKKEEIQRQKYLLGRAFSEVMCYGDQKNFLYLMSDRLGYREGR